MAEARGPSPPAQLDQLRISSGDDRPKLLATAFGNGVARKSPYGPESRMLFQHLQHSYPNVSPRIRAQIQTFG